MGEGKINENEGTGFKHLINSRTKNIKMKTTIIILAFSICIDQIET